jgi:hypothetical protein
MGEPSQGDNGQGDDSLPSVKTSDSAAAAAKSRETRQAAELRRNLQRRKMQQRDRRDQTS